MTKKQKIKIREIKKKISVRESSTKPLPKMHATSAMNNRQILLESIKSDNSKSLENKPIIIESPLEEVAKEAFVLPSTTKPEEKRDMKYVDNAKSKSNQSYQDARNYAEVQNYTTLEKNPEEKTTDIHTKHRENPFESQFERDQNSNNYSTHQDSQKKRKQAF